jgi:hypothetical protein
MVLELNKNRNGRFIGILIILALTIGQAFVFTILVIWARRRNKGANLTAAMFSFITPDPTFHKNYEMIQEVE